MRVDSERPRSPSLGGGNVGGGVTGREGSGDEAREDERGGGLGSEDGDGDAVSRVGVSGSRRCMREEKKPEIRLEARFYA